MRRLILATAVVFLSTACDGSTTEERNPLGVDPAELAELCIAYTSCFVPDQEVGSCISTARTLIAGTRWELSVTASIEAGLAAVLMNAECVEAAMGDCDGILACANRGDVNRTCDRERRCEGDTLISCTQPTGTNHRAEVSIDCAALELECLDFAGWPVCAEASGYTGEAERFSCQGPIALVEHSGVRYGKDCSLIGGRCRSKQAESGGQLAYACVGQGAKCGPEYVSSCAGDDFKTCLNGREAAIDCARVGMECGLNSDQQYSCVNPGGCHPYSDLETCADGTIRFCGIQGWEEVDCTALGFAGCEDSQGANCVEP
jgi:hypothetical protein